MVNHFRTLLLNLSDTGVDTEHIAKGFTARQLSSKPATLYALLFPTTDRTRKLELAQCYLELIEAAKLSEVIKSVDSRITYDLKTDFTNFKKASPDLSLLQAQIAKAGIAESILSLPKNVDTDLYDNIWRQHPNPIYKLAGLIAAYVIRLA